MQRCGVTQMAFTTRVLMSVRADGVITAITLRHPNIRDFLGSSGNGNGGGHGGGNDGSSVGWSASVAAKQAKNTNAAGAAAAGAVGGGGAAGHARRRGGDGDGGGAGKRGGCSVHEEGREMETKAGGVGGEGDVTSWITPTAHQIPCIM